MIATALHIDGLSTKPQPFIAVEPGESLYNLVKRFGGTIRAEHRPDPTRLQRKAKRAQEVGERVSLLLHEYDRWEDLPSPVHFADDNCIECDALRIVDGMLD